MSFTYCDGTIPKDATIGSILERYRDSSDTAFIFHHKKYSYKELNKRADDIAKELSGRGINKGDRVAIDMKRCPLYLYAIMGIIRSGACCVPLDAAWPDERKDVVMKTAGVKLCLKEDDLEGIPSAEPFENIGDPDDPVIVFYTSGSTGKPKGIELTHRNYISALYPDEGNILEHYMYENKMRMLSSYSLAFNGMAVHYLSAFMAGRSIVLCDEEESESFESLARMIIKDKVDAIKFYPAHFHAALSNKEFCKAAKKLGLITFAGGAVSSDFEAEVKRSTDAVIGVEYAATETAGPITENFFSGNAGTVGKPLSDLRLALIGEDSKEVPDGDSGEICVAGDRVFAGYLDSPQNNAQKFFVHPEYGKMFRTGDLGKKVGDELMYLGRLDRMVKIRGFRVELGEIEALLSSFPGIVETAVTVKGSRMSPCLAAYYLSEKDLDEEKLRSFLKDKLPDYSVPDVFIRVEEFPRTERGKVSYSELPEPEKKHGSTKPVTENEKLLFETVGEVLGIAPSDFGMEDSFASLGGDSILGMKVVSILGELGYKIKMRQIFNGSPLKEAAGHIVRSEASYNVENDNDDAYVYSNLPESAVCLAIEEAGGWENIQDILPLVPFTALLVIFTYTEPYTMRELMLRRVIKVKRGFTEESFRERAEEIIRIHPALRSLYLLDPKSGCKFQVVLKKGELSYFYKDISYLGDDTGEITEKQNAYIRSYMNLYLRSIKNLKESLIPHFVCFKLGKDLSATGFIDSNILHEGWSIQQLLSDLSADTLKPEEDNLIPCFKLIKQKDYSEDEKFWHDYVEAHKDAYAQRFSKSRLKRAKVGLEPSHLQQAEALKEKNGVSLPVLMYYCVSRAICEIKKYSDLHIRITYARNMDVPDLDRIVGCLNVAIPVIYKSGMSLSDFLKDIFEIEEHVGLLFSSIFETYKLPFIKELRLVDMNCTTDAVPEMIDGSDIVFSDDRNPNVTDSISCLVMTMDKDNPHILLAYPGDDFSSDEIESIKKRILETISEVSSEEERRV